MLANTLLAPGDVGIAGVTVDERSPNERALLDAYSESVSHIVARASPAVIHLEVRGNDAPGGSGSGFFISPDGYALTNSHVVSGARKIRAVLAAGRRLPTVLIGDDPDTDLAIVRVGATDVVHLALADSDRVRGPAKSPSPSAARWVSSRPSPPALSARSVGRSAPNPAAPSTTSSKRMPR